MFKTLASMCFVLFLQGPALANFKSGNELYEICQTTGNRTESGICIGYIEGLFDAWMLEDVLKKTTSFCISGDVTAGQLQDVVVLWLRKHPEKRHISAAAAVYLAVTGSFRCN